MTRQIRLKTINECFGALPKKPGLKKWRIQGAKLALQAKGNFGTFYDEESYFILQTIRQGFQYERKGHIWIGSEISQEEENDVLEIVAEIEEHVEDITVLYKQRQEHEAREFLDMFPTGIKYMIGTYGTYLKHQKTEFVQRLYKIEGKRNIRVKQIPLTSNEMSHGSSFILEDEWVFYIWNGRQSSLVERIKAVEVARTMRDLLCYGRAEIKIIDEDCDGTAEVNFFRMLGHPTGYKPKMENKSIMQRHLEHRSGKDIVTYRIEETNGMVNFNEEQYKFTHKNQLSPQYGYFMYNGCRVYIWIGSNSPRYVNNSILQVTQTFMADKGVAYSTPIQRMMESYETRNFRKLFDSWPYKIVDIEHGYVSIKNDEERFDSQDASKSMLNDMMADCSGKIKIWRINGFDIVDVEYERYGLFYDNTCYIVLYYDDDNKDYIIYIWQGILSNTEEKEYSMYYAQQIDNSLHGRATQIYIKLGDEPEHFLRLFQGKMMMLMDEAYVNESNYHVSFYQITGTHPFNTKTIQVPPYSSFLDSQNVYLLQTDQKHYVWEGALAEENAKDVAEITADRVVPDGDLMIIQEGFEPREFWLNLGGKEAYNNEKRRIKQYHRPRLFHCSDASGIFMVKEIMNFDQDDLNSDDVMILDTHEEIYIWIGDGANTNEKQKAWQTVKNFLENDPHGRTMDETSVMQVKQGQEPNCFANLFDDWDDQKANRIMNYDEVKRQIFLENNEVRKQEIRKQSSIKYLKFPREERGPLQRATYTYFDNQDAEYQPKSSFSHIDGVPYANSSSSSSYRRRGFYNNSAFASKNGAFNKNSTLSNKAGGFHGNSSMPYGGSHSISSTSIQNTGLHINSSHNGGRSNNNLSMSNQNGGFRGNSSMLHNNGGYHNNNSSMSNQNGGFHNNSSMSNQNGEFHNNSSMSNQSGGFHDNSSMSHNNGGFHNNSSMSNQNEGYNNNSSFSNKSGGAHNNASMSNQSGGFQNHSMVSNKNGGVYHNSRESNQNGGFNNSSFSNKGGGVHNNSSMSNQNGGFHSNSSMSQNNAGVSSNASSSNQNGGFNNSASFSNNGGGAHNSSSMSNQNGGSKNNSSFSNRSGGCHNNSSNQNGGFHSNSAMSQNNGGVSNNSSSSNQNGGSNNSASFSNNGGGAHNSSSMSNQNGGSNNNSSFSNRSGGAHSNSSMSHNNSGSNSNSSFSNKSGGSHGSHNSSSMSINNGGSNNNASMSNQNGGFNNSTSFSNNGGGAHNSSSMSNQNVGSNNSSSFTINSGGANNNSSMSQNNSGSQNNSSMSHGNSKNNASYSSSSHSSYNNASSSANYSGSNKTSASSYSSSHQTYGNPTISSISKRKTTTTVHHAN